MQATGSQFPQASEHKKEFLEGMKCCERIVVNSVLGMHYQVPFSKYMTKMHEMCMSLHKINDFILAHLFSCVFHSTAAS